MHDYRTHHCNELTLEQAGSLARLSGWVDRKRDHGGLLFIDLRDMHGITQCVVEENSALFEQLTNVPIESVLCVDGEVQPRTADTINKDLPTGEIELRVSKIDILSQSAPLPMPVNQESSDYPEEIRLRYRYLDLRRRDMMNNIILRNRVVKLLREKMHLRGFQEFHTPILTASSPEGARDFLVPSRLHPGKFYALPQAPQQFKQLLMVAGFDKYFQIAPCFRDEDARKDRSPGEFYQLDFEMAFATQQDVFDVIEPVLHELFTECSDKKVSPYPFQQITYQDAMDKYGSDKPDLRNPLLIQEVTEIFAESDFKIFAKLIAEKDFIVRGIIVPDAAQQPRSFFDKLNDWARSIGQAGLGYISFKQQGSEGGEGPIAKNLDEARIAQLKQLTNIKQGDAVFFVCGTKHESAQFAGQARTKIAETLDLIKNDSFQFCWITDFPFYELDEKTGKIIFSHNPFSMPQGGLDALNNTDPLAIKAWQYDIVCNGIELSSGAIRNHRIDIMLKAFEIAGYSAAQVEQEFGGMLTAFSYGAPPHGGAAPGIERIVMLLADTPNIREIVPFPMTQTAQDLMMGAPLAIADNLLEEVHIRVKMPILSD
ncbi:MAG: aspartate--tRNA ligase [Alphaproteobacteria bacterium]|nr:aspartate--tRNA ligase [Alphaproteobacteria bacterium]